MNPLSIAVSNLDPFQIDVDWTEIICPVPSSHSKEASHKLVIVENEKNKIVQNVLVPNGCVRLLHYTNTLRRKLTFDKKRIKSCDAREINLNFETTLRPCLNYSVYIFHSENVNPSLGADRYKNSFVIKTLEPEGKY